MDLVSSCKDKLVSFRIKELKDVLSKLGLSKQGKKQDLVDRILATLSDDQVSRMLVKKNAVGKEEVAKLVDDTFRKMHILGATDLASKGQCGSDSSNVKVKPKEECNDSFKKIRCPCGISLETEPIVQCDDPKCRIWQHIGCVVVPEKPMDPPPQIPDLFYCEICRLSRADPFLVTIAHPLLPVKLAATSVPTDSTNPVQSVDKTFQLTRADKDLLSKPDYDVQAWCILLGDKVPFRMQWPQYADLQVNALSVRAINRPGSQLLGINGRDDGPVITPFTKDGINKIALSGCDSRIFCLGVRIVKRRTVQQILNLIPKESDGERFEDALARVRRCVGCGTTTDNADSDSDLEVVADSFTVSLRCPMSGSRIKVAGRFKPCPHMGCFDLDTFVEMNQRSRKWQCPVCLKNYSLENLIIDPYFNRITSKVRNCVEDVTDIEVKPDGCWRLKDGTVTGELLQWHLPDGAAVCPPDIDREIKPKMEVSKQVKQEVGLDGHASLKLGIKKNRNGCWEVSKPEDNTSPGNMLHDRFESNGQKVIPMSSSAAGSGPDGEDASVNQDVCENFDFSPTVDPMHGFCDENPSAPVHDPEVIVLSDSEEETGMISSGGMYGNNVVDANGVPCHNPREVSNSFTEDPTLGPGWNSCLGPFNSNDDEFRPGWTLPPSTQTGSGFQLFGTDAVVSDALVNLQHDSMDHAIPINGYTLAPETAMASSVLVPDSSIDHPNCGINDGLVDNPLAFDGNDPSLQIFLPTGPSDASAQSCLRDQVDLSNANRSDDWISLRIGHSCSGGDNDFEAGNGLNSRERPLPKEDIMNCVPGTASLFPGTNDRRSEKASRQRSDSDSPFSFPRVRQRLILSIDSDSE